MFCNKCGKNNPDTASFCTGCGEKLPVYAPPLQNSFNAQNTQNFNGNANMQVKSNKNNKKLIVGIAIAVVLVIIIVASVLGLWLFGGDKDSGKSSASSSSSASSESSDSSESSTTSTTSTTSNPEKDFTTDMTVAEFSQKVAELVFYGKHEEAKKYYLIEEVANYYPFAEGMEDLEHVLKREECVERTNKGIGYEVSFEHYSTETKGENEIKEMGENNIKAMFGLYYELTLGIDLQDFDIDYSKITKICSVFVNVEMVFDDNYKVNGVAELVVVRYGDSWRCILCAIDM